VLCQQGSTSGMSATESMAACENARQTYAAAGDRNNEARTLNDFAGVYFQQGDLARAEAMWREAAPEFRQVGDAEGIAAASNNLGDVFLLQGRLSEAKKFLEQAIPEYRAIEDKSGVAGVLTDLGSLSRQTGNLVAAINLYEQAMATAVEIDDKSVAASALTGLGDAFADRGDLVKARKSYEDSLGLRNQTGEKQAAAETEIALASLSIEEGRTAAAEVAARKCSDQFHREQQADDELLARVVLIEALLAQGTQANAQKEIEGVQSLASKSENSFLRLRFALASARVALLSDNPRSSQRALDQVVQLAREHGFVAIELDAQLALAQLATQIEPKASARQKFVIVEKDARAKGFGLIARKAAAARS